MTASFGALFAVRIPPTKDPSLTLHLRTIYHVSIAIAFVLSLSTVVISTAALTKHIHGRYDPIAETGYLLLRREFDYEFVTSRWSFITSLLSFIIGVTCRILVEFELFTGVHRKNKEIGLGE